MEKDTVVRQQTTTSNNVNEKEPTIFKVQEGCDNKGYVLESMDR